VWWVAAVFGTGELARPANLRGALGLSALLSLCANAAAADTGRTPCCSALSPELPPATHYGAILYREDDSLAALRSGLPPVRDSRQSIETLESEVETLESLGGPMAARLSRPVAELGYAKLSQGHLTEAIDFLQRAVHLVRINRGLYTPAQEEMLKQLIAAHLRRGDVAAADEQQAYLYRVRQHQEYSPASPRMREATLHYADWMRGLYLGDVDRLRYPRLVGLNDLYESAIENIEASEGEDSRALLPYLQGRIELCYLVSVYPGERESGVRVSGGPAIDASLVNQAQLRFWRMRDYNFRYGREALERAEAVLQANPDSSAEELARARIARADWHQWHRRYAKAIRLYEEAWGIMVDEEDGADWLQREFATPLELPRSGVFNPGAVPLSTQNSAQVQMGFRVTRHGEARDIQILTETTDERVQLTLTRAYQYLRNVRFRPSLENGKVVAADDLQRTYQVRY